MEVFKIKDLSFRFPGMNDVVLNNISINICTGDFVVIGGPSGCGKTTLLHLLKRELAPVGECTGDIIYAGKLLQEWDDLKLIEDIGLVSQDPDNQIVMDEVMQEIVFGLENLGYSSFEMRKRVAEMVHFFGLQDLLKEKPSELSGGQKQMLNLLSVLLLKPKVLLLDEPTSQLDPVAAKDLITMLTRLNEEMGMTIVLVEHRLEELLAVADQVIMLEQGKVNYQGQSRDVIQSIYANQDQQFIPYIPSIARLYMEAEKNVVKEHIPLTVKESRLWMANHSLFLKNKQEINRSHENHKGDRLIMLKNIYYQYDKQTAFILKKLSLSIQKGEFFSLVGGNGSGKTTVLKACLGMIKPQRGSARLLNKEASKLTGKELSGHIAYLPQHPRTYFIQDTVEKEMWETIHIQKIDNGAEKITEMLHLFGISHLRHRHPYDCSGGEMQKAALACMLLSQPEILFVDEPTKGLDPLSKLQFAKVLQQLHRSGLTIVMVTHDIEFAAKYAGRCAMMFDGEITVDGHPEDLFKGNYFYTTTINKATRESDFPEVLTVEEAFAVWENPAVT